LVQAAVVALPVLHPQVIKPAPQEVVEVAMRMSFTMLCLDKLFPQSPLGLVGLLYPERQKVLHPASVAALLALVLF
jgi:hypothetical protein